MGVSLHTAQKNRFEPCELQVNEGICDLHSFFKTFGLGDLHPYTAKYNADDKNQILWTAIHMHYTLIKRKENFPHL
jgi:hypothetical protein